MPEPGKLGRNNMTYSVKTMRRALTIASVLDSLGPPPPISPGYSAIVEKLGGGDWGMFGNDQYGDCVFADAAHRILLWIASATGKLPAITTDDVLAAYTAATGFNRDDPDSDRGADIPTIAQFMETTGLAGHKSDGHGIIDPRNFNHVKWSIVIFGCIPFGLDLPRSAFDQFKAGQPWDHVPGSPSVGGHDVLGLEYNLESQEPAWSLSTWGKRWPATTRFMLEHLIEAVPIGSHEFITATGSAPSGVNLARMLADLRSMN